MADPGNSLAGEKRASSGAEANSPKRPRRSSLTGEKAPMDDQSAQPTDDQSAQPTNDQFAQPTDDQSAPPTDDQSAQPTNDQSAQPTNNQSAQPTDDQSTQPTDDQSAQPTDDQSTQPTDDQSAQPTDNQSTQPTDDQSAQPTDDQSAQPTDDEPTQPTDNEPTQPTDNEPTQPTDNEPTQPTDDEPTEDEPRDPGKRAYNKFSKLLKTLSSLKRLFSESDSVSKENKQKILDLLQKLRELCLQTVAPDEEPNPWKIVQIQLKHTFLNSEKISEEDNVKNFLMGLEDSSASKSDRNSAVFVFLANFATELWYQWEEGAGQWAWTPDWEFWMPCSETVVSGGQWKGETPAPENVEIINYLDAIRPIPSDEQYLPAFDIATLFKQLHGLSDPEVNESLRAIVAALEDVQLKRKHTTDFIEKLQKELAED